MFLETRRQSLLILPVTNQARCVNLCYDIEVETFSSQPEKNIEELIREELKDAKLFVICKMHGKQTISPEDVQIWPEETSRVMKKRGTPTLRGRYISAECPKCGSTRTVHVK